jgi:hypothetical protein
LCNYASGVEHAVLQHAAGSRDAWVTRSNGLLHRIVRVLLVPYGYQIFYTSADILAAEVVAGEGAHGVERFEKTHIFAQVAFRITIRRNMKELKMGSFHKYMDEYKKQLEKGMIQEAYRGLMEYILDLKTHFKNAYPDHFVSSSIYYGYMDMTYFSFTPKSFKDRNLKIAIVYIHEAFRFEVWLAGNNKQIQSKYWKWFKESGWKKYPAVPSTEGVDAILEHVLVDDPDFSDLDTLTKQIEEGTLEFIHNVEGFLARLRN